MEIFELILYIFLFIGVFITMFFIYVKIVRLLKKKSYHYIIPPKPENDKNFHPIDFSKYNKFIFLKNCSEDYFIEKINEFIDSADREIQIEKGNIELNKLNNWIVLRINNSSFFQFHFLVWSFHDDIYQLDENGLDNSNPKDILKSPENIVGLCLHKSINLKDYIIKLDRVLAEDNFIGSFRNGKNFGIYMPNASLNEHGNISLSRNHELNFYSEMDELPMELIDGKMIPFEKILKYYRQ